MASASDWLERSNWAHHTSEFVGLVLAGDATHQLPAMTFGVAEASVRVSEPCWELWQELPQHPHLVPAISPGVVGYAALDWKPAPPTDEKLATWGVDLTNLFDIVLSHGLERAAWLACPIAKVDLAGEVRVVFATAGRDSLPLSVVPPELVERWPFATDEAFVFSVGQCLVQLGALASPRLRPIVERCLQREPHRRFRSLEHLEKGLRDVGAVKRLRANLRPVSWRDEALEEGLGLLACGAPRLAMNSFAKAFPRNPTTERELAHELYDVAMKAALPPPLTEPLEPNAPVPVLPGPRPRRVFAVANGKVTGSTIHPAPLEAPMLPTDAVEVALRSRDDSGALALVDAQLAATPDDARAHHLRGKALFALGRIADARAAFDRACTLKPALLEAMLLRREMDRAMKDAGTANRVVLKLPEHLAELRDILVAGRIVDAIQLLRRPAYDDDRTAQLLLAELLVTDERLDDALVIFDRLGEPIGKARTLLALDRPGEALVALTSDADDALELRAKILLALKRGDEAERAMDEYLRAVERRSDRRLESR